MKLWDIFTQDEFEAARSGGYVRVQTHPTLPLSIANYTEKAQWEKAWGPVTSASRGLIFNHDFDVIARPFPKFFNLGEHGPEFNLSALGKARVFEKMDGSLGILYPTVDGPAVATRGSFSSEQAEFATEWLRRTHPEFMPTPGVTHLFEIIYPQNRIVVDYSGKEGLVALAAIDIQTGVTIPDGHQDFPGERVEEFPFTDETFTIQRPNREGFVLHFPEANQRVKIKHDEYVRLHRLVTGVTERTVWDLLANGTSLDELLIHVPEEFFIWVNATADRLRGEVAQLMYDAGGAFAMVIQDIGADYDPGSRDYRKAFAERATKMPHPSPLFMALDGKDITAWAWSQVKPEAIKPYNQIEVLA